MEGDSRLERPPDLQRWENLLTEQTVLFTRTVTENEKLRVRVEELERELSVWKLALKAADEEKFALKKGISRLERDIGAIKEDNPLILCLIDGDGNIFSQDLLSLGQTGGRQAAMLLTKGLTDYMSSIDARLSARGQLWLTIYCNKLGLLETLISHGICSEEEFEGFVLGFNQASPLFSIVDVGSGKEAADAKLKEFLRTFTRFPQTARVFFGGAHDNGYTTTLNHLENEGLLQKIILLRGYKELASELKTLNLPDIEIEGVFMTKKIFTPSHNYRKSPSPRTMFMSMEEATENSKANGSSKTPSVARTPSSVPRSLSPTKGVRTMKTIDPTQPISKQKPPPCNFFYLAQCKSGDKCRYGHDYTLSQADLEEVRTNSLKSPCPHINKNKRCPAGEYCCMGHFCPRGSKCTFFKQGKCKFTGKDMHAGDPAPNGKGKRGHIKRPSSVASDIARGLLSPPPMSPKPVGSLDPQAAPYSPQRGITLAMVAPTDYELERLERIKRNKAQLNALGFETPAIEPKAKHAKPKAAGKKRKAAVIDQGDAEEGPTKAPRLTSDDTASSSEASEGPRRSRRNAGKTVDYIGEQDRGLVSAAASAGRRRGGGVGGTNDTEPRSVMMTKRQHDPRTYGPIPGISVGTWWQKRDECSLDAIHAPVVGGISVGPKGAFSVAISGGYPDDVDLGYAFTYTGSGGRDLKGTKANPKNLRTAPQSSDQTFENSFNRTLKVSSETKKPVRVIRGFKGKSKYAPYEGYRYDGLYVVEKANDTACASDAAWSEPGVEGFLVCKYAFKRLPNQPPIPVRAEGDFTEGDSDDDDAEGEDEDEDASADGDTSGSPSESQSGGD
ncbi:hypothetical protein JAAARDRAFT_75984 [Jaapia argillacea MUCL 33604]|uniref:C3H1-type domain-containing protein n=1 Tax=Jaapia argillacea MUCL 33604 TaxID=933084 RepID=A0A067QJM7_9AGAM|nr:hypothetical protein JAAARDRAFT_75984 [Jaapia argillacea MUCL 33604]